MGFASVDLISGGGGGDFLWRGGLREAGTGGAGFIAPRGPIRGGAGVDRLELRGNEALVVDFSGGRNAVRDGTATPWDVAGFEQLWLHGTYGNDRVVGGDL